MSAGRFSLAQSMKVTALAAVDLAIIRDAPPGFLSNPIPLYLVVAINLVAVRGLILGRPLGAFHYTFLTVGALGAFAVGSIFLGTRLDLALAVEITNRLASRGRPGVQAILIINNGITINARTYQTSLNLLIRVRGILDLTAGLLCLGAAWTAGRRAAWRERQRMRQPSRRSRKVTGALGEGAIIGLGLITIASMGLAGAGFPLPAPPSPHWPISLLALAASMIIGALAVLVARRPVSAGEPAVAPGSTTGDPPSPTSHHREGPTDLTPAGPTKAG